MREYRRLLGARRSWGILALLAGLLLPIRARAEERLLARWTLDNVEKGMAADSATGKSDPLSGNYRTVSGLVGPAVKFDGYTTVLTREAKSSPGLEGAFSVSAWIALAAYPWNWCPVICQAGDNAGFSLEIGPDGEPAIRVHVGSLWRTCVAESALPLKTWVHVSGTFDPGRGLVLRVDGEERGRQEFRGRMTPAGQADLIIGSVREPQKPAYIHREFGTLPDSFSLDAILDDVRILEGEPSERENGEISRLAKAAPPPDIPPRILPSGPAGPGRFGAYYTRLSYHWEWDDLWRVADHPDIVVRFDDSPVKVVFWRGTRFSPAWVTENNLWMADQSVEAWNDEEGCFEHMQDRQCRYSHVRIIENTPARIVIHWRYAPVSAYDHLWKVDPRTGWGCWIDEYYTLYPDGAGIRNYTWEKSSLGNPHQFQESIPLAGPGQVQGDIIHPEYVTIANIEGEKQTFSYVENPPRETSKPIPKNPMIQMHNLKSAHKPFIIFEPGGKMHYLRDMNIAALSRPGSCSHWPVGQMRCDGRTQRTTDRATSFLGFPITDPVIHEGDTRNWVNSLYGMTDRPFDALLPLARSWVNSPRLETVEGGLVNPEYVMVERAYRLRNEGPARRSGFVVRADQDHPLANACFVIENWGESLPRVLVDGRALGRGPGLRLGQIRTLTGTDLLIWLEASSTVPVRITLEPDE